MGIRRFSLEASEILGIFSFSAFGVTIGLTSSFLSAKDKAYIVCIAIFLLLAFITLLPLPIINLPPLPIIESITNITVVESTIGTLSWTFFLSAGTVSFLTLLLELWKKKKGDSGTENDQETQRRQIE